jgi:hypothetical protein
VICGAGTTETVKLFDAEAFTLVVNAWFAVITAFPTATPDTRPLVAFTVAIEALFVVKEIEP